MNKRLIFPLILFLIIFTSISFAECNISSVNLFNSDLGDDLVIEGLVRENSDTLINSQCEATITDLSGNIIKKTNSFYSNGQGKFVINSPFDTINSLWLSNTTYDYDLSCQCLGGSCYNSSGSTVNFTTCDYQGNFTTGIDNRTYEFNAIPLIVGFGLILVILAFLSVSIRQHTGLKFIIYFTLLFIGLFLPVMFYAYIKITTANQSLMALATSLIVVYVGFSIAIIWYWVKYLFKVGIETKWTFKKVKQ